MKMNDNNKMDRGKEHAGPKKDAKAEAKEKS